MIVNFSYDTSVNSAPAAFKTAFSAAVTYFQNTFSDNVTVNLNVGYGEVGGQALGSGALGSSLTYLQSYSYAQVKNSLTADLKTADDSTAVASLPSTSPAPGGGTYWVATAEAKALGLTGASSSLDGYVGFSSTASFDYDNSNGVTAGQYDFYGTVAHEISEVMGRQMLVGGTIGATANSYEPLDLFHFSAVGTRTFSGTQTGYFSVNGGTTNLDNFNTSPGGDFGDWAASAGNDSYLAFSSSGVTNAITQTDQRVMDVLGWDVSQPDYVVSSITAGATVAQGSSYSFSYVITNQGTAGATSTSWGAAYLDQQVVPVTNSWSLTNALSAGATQTLSNSFSTAGLSLGIHTLWIEADNFNNANGQFNSGNNNVAESDETNNWRSVTFTVTAPALPDYVVSSITAGATVAQGSSYSFSYVITNQGTGGASSTSWGAAYLDQQVVPVTNSWSLTNALGASATQTLSNSISTVGLSLGIHTLWIEADNFNNANGQFNSGNNNVAESDETNNWRSLTFTVTAPALPDYVVSSITAGATVAQGSSYGFSYVITNQGTGAAAATSWGAAYLDQQVVPVTNSWSLTNALGASATQTLSNSISTAGLSLGTHTLWIEADNFNSSNSQFNSGNNDVAESNESNNWNSVTFTVTAPVLPDYVVSSISAGATVAQGASLSFSYVITNQGGGAAATSWGAAYLDQQVVPVTNSWSLTNALGASATQTLSNSFSTSGLSLGTHTLWIEADNFNSSNGQFNSGNNNVTESNESNNWNSVTFTVTAPVLPDYVVSSITAGASVMQGSNLSFSYVITNQGAGAASTSWGAAYLDQQVVPVTNSWNLTGALSGGGTQTLSNSINTSGLSVGTHTLWIEADNYNSSNGQFNSGNNNVTESNESNNWRSVTFNVTAPPASNFNIAVNFSGDSTYQSYFTAAAQRWQQIILGDLPDVNSGTYGFIDDLLISASVVSIDGVGGILGQAGPDAFRSGSLLPYHGVMQFDSADLANMAANGTLSQVILHEMGHILGIGTLWSSLGLKSGFNYTGANALTEYRTLSGNPSATSIPLETGGGSGTAGSHWSEALFGNELMTGYIAGIPDPLSRMTVGALQDLGYFVNYGAADAYTMPGHLVASNTSGEGGYIYTAGYNAGIEQFGYMTDPAMSPLGTAGDAFSNFDLVYASANTVGDAAPEKAGNGISSLSLAAGDLNPASSPMSTPAPNLAAADLNTNSSFIATSSAHAGLISTPEPSTAFFDTGSMTLIAQLGSYIGSTFASSGGSAPTEIEPPPPDQQFLAVGHA